MEKELRKPDEDLKSAFEYHGNKIPFSIYDIHNSLAAVMGENDGADWHWILELKDGRFGYVTGGCDYTGWDCRSSAEGSVFSNLEDAINAVPEKEEYYSRGNLREHIRKQIEGKENYGVMSFQAPL